MSRELEKAKVKLTRADKYLKLSIILFVVFCIGMSGLFSYQLYDVRQEQHRQQQQADERAAAERREADRRLEQALKDNERQEQRTQDYVKCIANALISPSVSRSSAIFDRCGIETDGAGQASTPTTSASPPRSSQTPAVMPSPPAEPKSPGVNQPTTSSPPDPEPRSLFDATIYNIRKGVDNAIWGLTHIRRNE